MPIQSYLCQKCSAGFDLLIGMTQEKPQLKCPNCHSEDIKKRFVSFGILGSGKGKSADCGSCSGGNCSSCSR